MRWAGDARTSEPLTDEPSHSRGGVADPRERMRDRRKLKTGGGGGRAARHTQGSVRAAASPRVFPRHSLWSLLRNLHSLLTHA